ncbi:MAG: glycosyltransferase [Ktedonobacterales bacterium]
MQESQESQESHKSHKSPESRLRKLAVVGTHLPRQCGIATFTTDLCEALAAKIPDATVFAVAVNDVDEGYPYPTGVRFEIAERDATSYQQAAEFLNSNDVDLVLLQHEFGIFGGPAGNYILELLRNLRMPVITVLHTVLSEPDHDQRQVLNEIAHLSERMVVMNHYARVLLRDVYQVPSTKVTYIPHGIPDVPFVDPNYYKDQFAAEGKVVLLTFGLLSPNKGIEHVISAMPSILERYPNVMYIVLGATHPHVLRQQGEAYRHMLQDLVQELDIEPNVVFYNQFVQLEELFKFIGAADIYITPYLNSEQIVSGTLAYTVGTGKAVISTPYRHAVELLDEGRGVLVPFRDAPAIAEKVIELLDDEGGRHAMRKRAYQLGRTMTWSQVAEQYLEMFGPMFDERQITPPVIATPQREWLPQELRPISVKHLCRMTDSTGLLQHATFSIPNYHEGYTTDDNARALIATTLLAQVESTTHELADDLSTRYLAFLNFAFNSDLGRFRNFCGYDRRWLEDQGSEDSHARTLWALGTVVGRSDNRGFVGMANDLFTRGLQAAQKFTFPRSWAFTLLGIHEYLKHFSGDRLVKQIRSDLAEQLRHQYEECSTPDWPWFESSLTYDNATLSRALLLTGHAIHDTSCVEAALNSLRWLMDLQYGQIGHFVPIGCHDFYRQGQSRARFDQQPIEAYSTIAACLDAYRVTGDASWRRQATPVFNWFLGHNDLQIPMVDQATGACYDGLQRNWVNHNQGAESTLAFLLASLEMRLVETELTAEVAAEEVERLLTTSGAE